MGLIRNLNPPWPLSRPFRPSFHVQHQGNPDSDPEGGAKTRHDAITPLLSSHARGPRAPVLVRLSYGLSEDRSTDGDAGLARPSARPKQGNDLRTAAPYRLTRVIFRESEPRFGLSQRPPHSLPPRISSARSHGDFFDSGKGARGGFASGFRGPGLCHDPRDHILANRVSGEHPRITTFVYRSAPVRETAE